MAPRGNTQAQAQTQAHGTRGAAQSGADRWTRRARRSATADWRPAGAPQPHSHRTPPPAAADRECTQPSDMSNALLVLSMLAAVLAGALARPNGRPKSVDLADAMNKTVCPIVVDYDVNENRIPQKIKVLKCAQEPNRWCAQQRIPPHECCQHSHNNHVMECVEIRDTVLVFLVDQNRTVTHDVSVGCTCMIEQSTQAPELSLSPT
ncbi:unnamed protein product [Colias eurytheme]|nr:unnamed protein product [Colias eurytheme]